MTWNRFIELLSPFNPIHTITRLLFISSGIARQARDLA